MLQRALASLLCLLGASSIGLGIASSTVWRASDTLVASAEAGQGSTLLLTEPGVLDMAAETVSVVATTESGDKVVLALGRTADVEAWVGEDPHTAITGLLDRETLRTEEGQPAEGTAAEPTPAATDPAVADPATEPAATDPAAAEASPAAPDPAGSDLWVSEASGSGRATLEWTREDGRWSVLAATVGPDAGPLTMTLTWPQEVTTPWLVPGVAAGSVLLLAGLVWWTFLLLRDRRAARWARAEGRTPSEPPVALGPPVAARTDAPPTVGAAMPVPGVLAGPRAEATAPGATPPAAVPVSVISGSPTRRQLRERERLAATGGIPQVPTGQPQPQPQPVRPQAGPVRLSAGGPAAAEAGEDASEVGASGSPLSRWGRRMTERGPRRVPTPVSTDAGPLSPQASVPAGLPPSRGPAGGAGQAPTAARPGPAGGEGRPAAAAAPSADLWRRAWGFPSGVGDDGPGQSMATSAGPAQPGHPPQQADDGRPKAPRTTDDRDEKDGEHR